MDEKMQFLANFDIWGLLQPAPFTDEGKFGVLEHTMVYVHMPSFVSIGLFCRPQIHTPYTQNHRSPYPTHRLPPRGWEGGGVYRMSTYMTVSPSLHSVMGIRVSLKVGELSTTRCSMSPTIVTFSFFTDTVFSVIVTSASGAVYNTPGVTRAEQCKHWAGCIDEVA